MKTVVRVIANIMIFVFMALSIAYVEKTVLQHDWRFLIDAFMNCFMASFIQYAKGKCLT